MGLCLQDDARSMRVPSFLPSFMRVLVVVLTALSLEGCALRGAPSYNLFGAFFPAWLLCAAIGALGSLGIRAVALAIGLDAAMPLKLVTYLAFAATLALSIWLLLFGID